MSNEITINNGFTVARVTKSGKTQRRGVLGTITSGNKAEREALFLAAVPAMLAGNTYGPIMQELVRVFPAGTLKAKDATEGLAVVGGELWLVNGDTMHRFNPAAADMCSVVAYAKAVVAKHGSKEAKGEKALYLQVARAVVQRGEEKAAAKAAAELAASIEA